MTNKMDSFWSKDPGRERRLIALNSEGRGNSEIAKILGCSRHCVNSKMDRLRLAGAPLRALKKQMPITPPATTTPFPNRKPGANGAQRPPHFGTLNMNLSRPVPAREDAWKPIDGQEPAVFGAPKVCKWPLSLMIGDEPACCGAKKAPTEVYCKSHRAMAGGARTRPPNHMALRSLGVRL